MSAPVYRGDYDALKTIAGTLRSQGDAIKSMNQRLEAAKSDLQSGNWIGKGADAFYKEFDGQVKPALQRLANALSQAGSVTQQIAQVTKQAEDESAACFRVA